MRFISFSHTWYFVDRFIEGVESWFANGMKMLNRRTTEMKVDSIYFHTGISFHSGNELFLILLLSSVASVVWLLISTMHSISPLPFPSLIRICLCVMHFTIFLDYNLFVFFIFLYVFIKLLPRSCVEYAQHELRFRWLWCVYVCMATWKSVHQFFTEYVW